MSFGVLGIFIILVIALIVVLIIKASKRPTQSNNGDEMIAKIHWVTLVPAMIYTLVAIFLFGSMLGSVVMGLIITIVLGAILEKFAGMPLYGAWVKFLTTELTVTPTRLVGKTGLFNVKRVDFPTEQISSVEINSTFWGQLLNYSDIIINTSGGEQRFEMIGNAAEFQRYCLDLNEKKEDRYVQKQADAMKDAFSSALKENQSQASQMEAPSGNKYCSSCGSKVSPGAAYCPSCGAKVN